MGSICLQRSSRCQVPTETGARLSRSQSVFWDPANNTSQHPSPHSQAICSDNQLYKKERGCISQGPSKKQMSYSHYKKIHCCCLATRLCPTLLWPHGLYPARLFCPRDFLGNKNSYIEPNPQCNDIWREPFGWWFGVNGLGALIGGFRVLPHPFFYVST